MNEVIVFGTGGIGAMVHHYLTFRSKYTVIAHTIDGAYITVPEYKGLPLVPFETVENVYPAEKYAMFIGLGYLGRGPNQLRSQRYNEAKKKGYSLITYVDKAAFVAEEVEIGENCFISPYQTIEPFVKIGNDVITRSGCYIGHDVIIGDHCFVGPQAVIGGGAVIEPFAVLGSNSTLRNGVKIGKRCVIGAGAIILKNTRENEVYRGLTSEPLQKKSYQIKI
jgi:sugar O-acyltransferase (sialic acid O-acetyltransferase NeuD family)